MFGGDLQPPALEHPRAAPLLVIGEYAVDRALGEHGLAERGDRAAAVDEPA